jgi:hypothetical protein
MKALHRTRRVAKFRPQTNQIPHEQKQISERRHFEGR